MGFNYVNFPTAHARRRVKSAPAGARPPVPEYPFCKLEIELFRAGQVRARSAFKFFIARKCTPETHKAVESEKDKHVALFKPLRIGVPVIALNYIIIVFGRKLRDDLINFLTRTVLPVAVPIDAVEVQTGDIEFLREGAGKRRLACARITHYTDFHNPASAQFKGKVIAALGGYLHFAVEGIYQRAVKGRLFCRAHGNGEGYAAVVGGVYE